MIALLRLIEEAKVTAGGKHRCHILGHQWRLYGSGGCGCKWLDDDGRLTSRSCSVPVYECDACGDCDYGENAEADALRSECAAANGEPTAGPPRGARKGTARNRRKVF